MNPYQFGFGFRELSLEFGNLAAQPRHFTLELGDPVVELLLGEVEERRLLFKGELLLRQCRSALLDLLLQGQVVLEARNRRY